MKTLYGLPEKVCFCKKCVISNQRPSSIIEQKHTIDSKKKVINFSDGICDACRVKTQKEKINWEERESQLLDLCEKYRSKDGSYDCIVPGSGGKDSFMQAHLLKYKYKMNPLTVTWAPHMYTTWGLKNFEAWVNAGFDNIKITPNGKVHRLLTRLAMDTLLHPFQPFIIGQRHIATKLAVKLNIPLIFYGESGSEYGNPLKDSDIAIRSFNEYEFFNQEDNSQVFLSGISLDELFKKWGLSRSDIDMYMPPNPEQVVKKNIQVHWLGYYTKWHPQGAYYYSVENGDFKAAPERTIGTYSTYNSIDDKIDDLHYYTTYIKFGIGRATYDASQEIRSGEIDRKEGVALVRKYDGEYPSRFMKEICKYLSFDNKNFLNERKIIKNPDFSEKYFSNLLDKFRSPHLWKFDKDKWHLKHQVV